MPYAVTKNTKVCPVSKPWAVTNQVSGKVHGCHASKEKAQAQQAALYAAEGKKSEETMSVPEIETARQNDTRALLPMQFRVGEFDRASIDLEKRTVRVAFSSEYPVERMGWFSGKKWVEILDHSPSAVRMDRLKNGAAVLFNHRSDQMIGVVEEPEINAADKKGRATLRFGRSALASEKFQDVMDGILRHVSVGYIDHEVRQDKKSDSEPDVWRVTDWEPIEISMVAAPADPSVGVGRDLPAYPVRMLDAGGREISSFRNSAAPAAEEEKKMDPINTEERSTTPAPASEPPVKEVPASVSRENYAQVAADIQEVGIKYEVPQKMVHEALSRGWSLGEAKEHFADHFMRQKAGQTGIVSGMAESTVRGMTSQQRREYSVARAIQHLAGEGGVYAGLELDVSNSIAKQLKRTTQGMFIPTCLQVEKRAGLDTKTGAAGGYTVATQVGDLIDMLRNRIILVRMGARVLGGLQDTLAFPVKVSGSSVYWMAENPGADVTQTDAVWGQKAMTPKILAATTAYSRKLLSQSSLDIEGEVRRDLADAHACEIDRVGLYGSGTSNQPLGILKTDGLGDVAMGTDGAVPTFLKIIALETAVAVGNADVATMSYLSTPGIRGVLKGTPESTASGTTSQMIWRGGSSVGVGEMNGYPAYVSNNVPSTLVKGSSGAVCHAILFGDWSQVIIGEWGVLELVVDPYQLKKQGMIEVTSYQQVDVLVRQAAGLSAIQDAKLS